MKPSVTVTPVGPAGGVEPQPGKASAAEPAAPAKKAFEDAAQKYEAAKAAAIQKLETNRAPTDSRANFTVAVHLLEDGNTTGADTVFSDDIYLRAAMRAEFNAMDRLCKEAARLKPAADAEGQALFEKRMKDDPVFRAKIEAEAKDREQERAVDDIKQRIQTGTPLSEADAKSNKLFAVLRDFFPGKPSADAPPHLKNKEPDEAALSAMSSEEVTVAVMMYKDPGMGLFLFNNSTGVYSSTIRAMSGERSPNNMADVLRSFEMRDFEKGQRGYDRVAIGDGGGLNMESGASSRIDIESRCCGTHGSSWFTYGHARWRDMGSGMARWRVHFKCVTHSHQSAAQHIRDSRSYLLSKGIGPLPPLRCDVGKWWLEEEGRPLLSLLPTSLRRTEGGLPNGVGLGCQAA